MKNIFRIVSLAAAVAVLPSVVTAQDQQFKKDTKIVYAGFLAAGEGYGGAGIGGGLEIGVAEIANGVVRLGAGGFVGFLKHDFGGLSYDLTTIPAVVFVNGHYQIEAVPKLDVYAGPVVGMAKYTYDCGGTSSFCARYANRTDAAVGIHAGARYALTSAILGSLEVSGGSNLPWANIGVAFKF